MIGIFTLSLPTPNYYTSPPSLSARNLPPPSPAISCVFYITLPSEGKFYPQAGSLQNQFSWSWDRVFRNSADIESTTYLFFNPLPGGPKSNRT
jgi:hypothetical protein